MESKANISNLKRTIGIIVGLLIVGSLALSILAKREESTQNEKVVNNVAENEIEVREDDFFYFPRGNFEFKPLSSWENADPDLIPHSKDRGTPYFAFTHKELPCAFSYALLPQPDVSYDTPESEGGKYYNTSFADRVFTEGDDQLDGHWSAPLKPGLRKEFQWEGRNPLPGEVRDAIYAIHWGIDARQNAFLLFATDGNVVENVCDKEFSQTLKTLRPKYDEVSNLQKLNGSLYIKPVYGDNTSGGPRQYLLFAEDQGPTPRLIQKLKAGYQVSLHRGKYIRCLRRKDLEDRSVRKERNSNSGSFSRTNQ